MAARGLQKILLLLDLWRYFYGELIHHDKLTALIWLGEVVLGALEALYTFRVAGAASFLRILSYITLLGVQKWFKFGKGWA